ncbi:alpha-lytic protease prodomain-containing protein [Streptomyces sp. NPDC088246]|uniref:alpha-lytic protease prodomain-containing protein n=1 Tax=Streptomyces sp. NPDC088246 TaxID=3365842 RepID=UPI0037F4DFC9
MDSSLHLFAQAAAESVRNTGGAAKAVTNSAAALDAIHAEWDQLSGIPNTSWGVDPSSNQVTVDIYEVRPPPIGCPDRKSRRCPRRSGAVIRVGGRLPSHAWQLPSAASR